MACECSTLGRSAVGDRVVSGFEAVWTTVGPPSLRMERAEIDHEGRRWTQHRLISQSGLPGVVIIARNVDHIAFIEIYRPAVGQVRLELPRGFGETNPLDDGARELGEETGLRAVSLHVLGQFDLDTGLVPTPINVVLADVADTSPSESTDGEAEATVWRSMAAVQSMIRRGEARDAITLAALALFLGSIDA